MELGVGGVVGQQVSQQQEVLWRVLAGVMSPGAFYSTRNMLNDLKSQKRGLK
jgi:hypothetical protein